MWRETKKYPDIMKKFPLFPNSFVAETFLNALTENNHQVNSSGFKCNFVSFLFHLVCQDFVYMF